MKTSGYACTAADEPLVPFTFERRAPRSNDVVIEIMYCGVCHSDLHQARNDWGWTTYPIVPGHEIVGRVIEIGSAVSKFGVGDFAGVGCMVDSCRSCDQCVKGEEQFCREGNTQTYNSPDRITGENTLGGFARHIVVREDFVLKVPGNLDISKVAPLLCAGVTTYSPLKTYSIGSNSRVGVVGLGGLGHMAVKLAHGLGAQVTVISRTLAKEDDAKALGASGFLSMSDEKAVKNALSSFDLIIDTVPVQHDVSPYLPLLDVEGAVCLVGQFGPMNEFSAIPLITGKRQITGSLIGGIRETQEVLDFCGRENILPECEMIKMEDINSAFDRMEQSDVRYRFVIDMQASAA